MDTASTENAEWEWEGMMKTPCYHCKHMTINSGYDDYPVCGAGNHDLFAERHKFMGDPSYGHCEFFEKCTDSWKINVIGGLLFMGWWVFWGLLLIPVIIGRGQ